MPPECVTDEHAYLSPAADVYALGLLLFHMVAGRGAYDAMTLPAILDSKRRGGVRLRLPLQVTCDGVALRSRWLWGDTAVRMQGVASLSAVWCALHSLTTTLHLSPHRHSSYDAMLCLTHSWLQHPSPTTPPHLSPLPQIPPLPVPSLPLCVLYSQCLCADRKKRPSMTDVRDQLIALLPAVCGPA